MYLVLNNRQKKSIGRCQVWLHNPTPPDTSFSCLCLMELGCSWNMFILTLHLHMTLIKHLFILNGIIHGELISNSLSICECFISINRLGIYPSLLNRVLPYFSMCSGVSTPLPSTPPSPPQSPVSKLFGNLHWQLNIALQLVSHQLYMKPGKQSLFCINMFFNFKVVEVFWVFNVCSCCGIDDITSLS